MKLSRSSTLVWLLIVGSSLALGQTKPDAVPARQGAPAIRPRVLPPANAALKTTSPLVLLRSLTTAEIANRRKSYPTAVGQNRSLPGTLRGNWLQDTGGHWFWSIAVQAISAGGLRLHFTGFDAGQGQVWVHTGDPERGALLGPWTGSGPLNSGDFWTEIVDGDTAYVEYSPADGVPGGQPPFTIPEMFHLWSYAPRATNLGCFLDETCYDGNAFVGTFSKAVALLIFSDHACSGTLLNDRNNTGTPYLITAGHCILDAGDAASMLAVFDFKTSACNGSANNYGAYPQVSGSTLLSRSLDTPDGGSSIILDRPDFAFVQLPRFPNVAYTSMGWATTPTGSDRMTSISHPRVLPQRLASGNITSSSDPNFYTVHMNQGAADHGSSGSGLITDSDQLVAVDSYASNGEDVTACDITNRDYGYTKFAVIYPFIQQWLEAAGAPKPVASVAPSSLNLGTQQVQTTSGAQSSVLSNVGKASLTISSITIQGANAAEFSLTGNCGFSLAAGASCTITVTFRPVSAGLKSASVSIADNAPGSPQTIVLSGTATAAATVPVVLDQVTTNINVLANGGGCHAPPPVTAFVNTTPAVWLYFDVTGATLADVYHISWYKPDGSLYTTFNVQSTFAGYECFSYNITLAGATPASLPGTWAVKIFWDQQTTPLFTTSFTISVSPVAKPSQALQLFTVAPCRIFDTRSANGPFGGPSMAAGTSRTIPIPSSSCGVPANALAYSLNFTVVPAGSLRSLTVWPTGSAQPNTSTLTAAGGSAVAVASIVPAGTAGSINAYTSDTTDLIIDINGFFVPPTTGSLQFYPLPPCRVLDTRTPAEGSIFPANSTFGSPSLIGGVSRSFPIPSSSCHAPANAQSYSLNLTLVPQGTLGYLTAFPSGQPVPWASNMNSWDGGVLANAAIVPAGTGGAVSFFAANTTDLVVDINGYFAPPGAGGLNFYTVSPCRLVDTRNANGDLGGPAIGANATRSFPLPESSCGIPGYPAVQAYSLTMTALPQGVLGFLSTWPTGQPQPTVSTLNAWRGQVAANAALVPAGTAGAINVLVTAPTNVTIDTAGYFGP